jgi:hypothetical protein
MENVELPWVGNDCRGMVGGRRVVCCRAGLERAMSHGSGSGHGTEMAWSPGVCLTKLAQQAHQTLLQLSSS